MLRWGRFVNGMERIVPKIGDSCMVASPETHASDSHSGLSVVILSMAYASSIAVVFVDWLRLSLSVRVRVRTALGVALL